MRARHNLIEVFSSFIQFEADHFRGWLSDPRLKRNMQGCYKASSAADMVEASHPEKNWAIYWHRQWQDQPKGIARDHLLAYLQEACYWVAQKTSSRFKSTQYGINDCFQLAIAQFEKVLKNFDPNQGFDLKNYASTTFRSLIRDSLRQRREIDICTNWSLLRKVSQKRFICALETQGLTEAEIEPYLLAWNAYKLIYVPTQATTTRRLADPDSQTWVAIAKQFNTNRHRLSSLASTVSPKQVEMWMTTAAKAIRQYLYPGSVSVNATRPGQDSGEFIDNLTDTEQTTPITELILTEENHQRQQQQKALNDRLVAAIAELEPEAQKLLSLYYGDAITQQDIANQLGIKQYSISRKLARIKKTLLLILGQWVQETLHIPPSPDVLIHSSAALEEWLTTYYGD